MTDESSTPAGSIPDTWIESGLRNCGFLPSVGVHLRGNTVVQETSRSVWIGASVMWCFGLLALIPVTSFGIVMPKDAEIPYYVQIVVALGLFWGAICAVVGMTLINNKCGVSVTVDLNRQNIAICHGELMTDIPINRVIGLQVLRGPKAKGGFRGPVVQGGFQLNLVFRRQNGEIGRESLHTDAIRWYVMRMAKSYERYAGWPILEANDSGPKH